MTSIRAIAPAAALAAATFAFAAAFLGTAGGAHAEALDLVCRGTAVHTEQAETSGAIRPDSGRHEEFEDSTMHNVRSEESLRVRIDGKGLGAIQPPLAILPPIHKGKNGWWDLQDLSVTEDSIRGKYALNMLNHPTVEIDRRSGDITMHGMGLRFAGTCEKAPVEPVVHKF